MTSEKRSQAARANGARSRGPITPEGKATSSRNATRHGLLAKTVVLANENPQRFEELFNLLIARFSPVDDIELSAIEEMAAAHWRLRRIIAIEHAILQKGIANSREEMPSAQLAAAFCDPVNLQSIAILNRYETRIQNMYQRALRGLALLRKIPPQSDPLDPVPPDPEPIAPVPNEPKTPNLCTAEDAPTHPSEAPTQVPPAPESPLSRCGVPRTFLESPLDPLGPPVFP